MLVKIVRQILSFSAIVLVLASASCAHHKKDQTVCPEYRSLRCTGGTQCSMDQERGCRVCQCTPHNQLQEESPDSNARPPE